MSDYVPKPDLEGINSPAAYSPVKDALILVSGFLVLVSAFYFTFVHFTDWAFTKISPETEMRLFSKLWPENMKGSLTIDKQPEDFKTLVALVNKETKLPLRVSIICDDSPNAFALPGGAIYMTSGLFSKLKSENGVAFVLGHEIGHFVHRDHIRGIGRQLVYAIGASLFGFADLTSLRSIDGFIARGFDRHQESDADTYALALSKKLYGHTFGAEEFFEELSKEETLGLRALSRLSSTHPLSSERFARVRATQTGSMPQLKLSEDHFKSWTAHCPH